MIYHFVTFIGVKDKLSEDKQVSVQKLQYKLDETKKESEESYLHFLSLSQTLGSGVIMVNDDGKINFANKDVLEYFDFDFNNKYYEDIQISKPLYKFISKAYLLEQKYRKQIVYEDKYFDLLSTPIFEDDIFKGCLIIIHDITTLRTAENFQKRFTADVSHELKTPLSSIKGISEILNRDRNMEEKDRNEFIEILQKESVRMETILNDLLIISKMDRIDYELTVTEVHIGELVLESTNALKRLAKEKNIELITNVKDEIISVDKNKIAQVIINLIKNAINYTDEGSITVTGYTENDFYTLQVSDTGIGINSEEIENIFKRFYRIDGARSRDSGGSGLGLSIVKNVVLKHGGNIQVDSIKDEGTTFIITLPL